MTVHTLLFSDICETSGTPVTSPSNPDKGLPKYQDTAPKQHDTHRSGHLLTGTPVPCSHPSLSASLDTAQPQPEAVSRWVCFGMSVSRPRGPYCPVQAAQVTSRGPQTPGAWRQADEITHGSWKHHG